ARSGPQVHRPEAAEDVHGLAAQRRHSSAGPLEGDDGRGRGGVAPALEVSLQGRLEPALPARSRVATGEYQFRLALVAQPRGAWEAAGFLTGRKGGNAFRERAKQHQSVVLELRQGMYPHDRLGDDAKDPLRADQQAIDVGPAGASGDGPRFDRSARRDDA